jgi:hypothetical protein
MDTTSIDIKSSVFVPLYIEYLSLIGSCERHNITSGMFIFFPENINLVNNEGCVQLCYFMPNLCSL